MTFNAEKGIRQDAIWSEKILPLRQQAEVINRWLDLRLKNLLPKLMKDHDLECWLVACREYNEDPVYMTMVPEPVLSARRLSILAFIRKEDEVERYVLARFGMGGLYQSYWPLPEQDQWQNLKKLLTEKNPKNIAVNIDHTFAFADGLSHAIYTEMKENLGPELSEKFVPSQKLAISWLETRIDEEVAAYEGIMQIAHGVIGEAFSEKVVHPGITTPEDVLWWIRQRFVDLGLKPWFQPSVSIQRKGFTGLGRLSAKEIIMPGDLLHCDVGFGYLRLQTDTQQKAYVLIPGETDAPQGLQDALAAGNRLQDIVCEAMVLGKTGNQILAAARQKALEEGLVPCVYNHPIGFHGHGAGPTIGLFDNQVNVAGRGDYPLHDMTCHALELNVQHPVPEWDNELVTIALEQTIIIENGKARYFDGRQTGFHLIR
ncbi:MAG: aminopeptidase P family protein [Firmicutes bacterium]|nr:aminopeptidase P family protein [Bacillota bacterium]